MILITKPAHAPAHLSKGREHVLAHEAERLADVQAGASAQRAFKFWKAIYGASVIKKALRKAQHDKCCYCEGVFISNAAGDVEHFRPKACFRQAKDLPIERPGYYWLAYTWSNLYFVCEKCNRGCKGSLFPVSDPNLRQRHRNDPLGEQPEILDPGGTVDPRDHIRFNGATAWGVTALGRTSIRIYGLNRDELEKDRLRHLQILEALRDLASLPPELLKKAVPVDYVKSLKEKVGPMEKYSAMAQDFLQGAIV